MAIHAPLDVDWVACSPNPLFNSSDGYDESLPAALTVLPSVIEKNQRIVLVQGLATLLLLQMGSSISSPSKN